MSCSDEFFHGSDRNDTSDSSDDDDVDVDRSGRNWDSRTDRKRIRLRPPGEEWQESKRSVAERVSYLFNNTAMSDVKFLIGPVKSTFYAHKVMVAFASPFFYSFFYGPMATSESVVKFPETDPEVFHAFLKHVYLDEFNMDLSVSSALRLLEFSAMYLIPQLATKCRKYVASKLSPENVLSILKRAQLLRSKRLQKICWRFISWHFIEVGKTAEFLEVDRDVLCKILKSSSVIVNRESDVLNAALKWSEAECGRQGLEPTAANKKNVLGEALTLIRFPLMNAEEFSESVPHEMLAENEIVSMYKYFASKEPKPNVRYSSEPRAMDLINFFDYGLFGRARSERIFPLFRHPDFTRTYTSYVKFTATDWLVCCGVSVPKVSTPNRCPLKCRVFVHLREEISNEGENSEATSSRILRSASEAYDVRENDSVGSPILEQELNDWCKEIEFEGLVSIRPGQTYTISVTLQVIADPYVFDNCHCSENVRMESECLCVQLNMCIQNRAYSGVDVRTSEGFIASINITQGPFNPPESPRPSELRLIKSLTSALLIGHRLMP